MVFNTFSALVARPVHEETVWAMHHRDGDCHVHGNAEGRDSTEQTDNKADAAEEFGKDREHREYRRYSHVLREAGHGGGEPTAAEPAERLLRAMREEDDTKNDSRQGQCVIVGGLDQLPE